MSIINEHVVDASNDRARDRIAELEKQLRDKEREWKNRAAAIASLGKLNAALQRLTTETEEWKYKQEARPSFLQHWAVEFAQQHLDDIEELRKKTDEIIEKLREGHPLSNEGVKWSDEGYVSNPIDHDVEGLERHVGYFVRSSQIAPSVRAGKPQDGLNRRAEATRDALFPPKDKLERMERKLERLERRQ